MSQIGKSINRLEGPLKVTGAAKYAGEYNVPGLLYGYAVNSSITKGKITKMDTAAAEALPGVVKVFTHKNRPSVAWFDIKYSDMDAPTGAPFRPLQNGEIKYNGEPIALVVADTFEMASYGASLVHVEYEEIPFETDLEANFDSARTPKVGIRNLLVPGPPKPKGDFEKEYDNSFAKSSMGFKHGTEHHNPMELFSTTTIYEGKNKVTIYDKTQGTVNVQLYVGNVFGLHFKDVRVISPFVGGAFGSGLRPQYQLFLSVMACLELKKPVRVTLDRKQMFSFSHRPPTFQTTRFGADKNGKVTALNHDAIAETSRYEDYTENVVNWANMLYPAMNTLFEYKLVPLDVFSPLDMRAPGGSTGLHAIESTMDDLAYQLKIDPLEFRLINYAGRDVSVDRPYSSKELRQCYLQGAERFGWAKRNPEPRSMRHGNKLVGYGMATGIWEANTLPARAEATITKEGKLIMSSATSDIGTGTFTVMTQIAADEFGMPIEDVTFIYGDSKKPFAPLEGGSFTVSTISSAIAKTAKALKKNLLKKARDIENSPLKELKLEEVYFKNGKIISKENRSLSVSFKDIIAANDGNEIKLKRFSTPNVFKLKKYSRAAHSAVFVEVEVDEQLGVVNVTRALTACAAGKIINPKTAASQVMGSMVWGISKVLMEETISDYRFGKYMNPNFAEYHIPVHADVNEMDVLFVEEKDDIVNPLGAKGIGEIGLVGMPPAIANAIFHATGKRINQFPIHFEWLMA